MKRVLLLSVILSFSILIFFATAQNSDYVIEEKIQTSACDTNNGFVERGTFQDNDNTTIHHCIKLAPYSESSIYVINSYLSIEVDNDECINGGTANGFFEDSQARKINLCVDRATGGTAQSNGLLIYDTSTHQSCAGDYYETSPQITVYNGATIKHCVRGGNAVGDGGGQEGSNSDISCGGLSGGFTNLGIPQEDYEEYAEFNCHYNLQVPVAGSSEGESRTGVLIEGDEENCPIVSCVCDGGEANKWSCQIGNPDECTDGDNTSPSSISNSESIKTKSTTSNATMTKEDTCYNGQQVTENYCVVKDVRSNRVTCPEGTSCVDGACLTPEEAACIDSDGSETDLENIQNGNSIYERGNATEKTLQGYKVTKDSCDDDKLKEAVCATELGSTSVEIECEEGYTCSETEEGGACIREKEWDVTEHSWAEGCPENKFMIGRADNGAKMKCAYLALEDGTELKWESERTLGSWFKQNCNNDEAIVGFVPGERCKFIIGCFGKSCRLGCTGLNGPSSYKLINQGTIYPGKTICAKVALDEEAEESIGWSSDLEVSTASDCNEGQARVMLGIEKDACASLELGAGESEEENNEESDNEESSSSSSASSSSNSGGFLGGLFGGNSGGFLSQIISWLNPLNWIGKLFGG